MIPQDACPNAVEPLRRTSLVGVLAALLGIVVGALLGLSPPRALAAPPSSATTVYTYDGHRHTAVRTPIITERGPPSSPAPNARYDANGRLRLDASPDANVPATPATYRYDDVTRSVHCARRSCGAAEPVGSAEASPVIVRRSDVAAEGATAALPRLTGTIADSFEGGAYTTQTFKAGTTFYRAEGSGQGIGSFFGMVKPGSAAEAEKLFNIAKWGNNADVVSTYRLTSDTTMYMGRVAGGEGMQALVPRGSDLGSLFKMLGQEPLP